MRSDRERLLDIVEYIEAIMRHTGSGRASLNDEAVAAAVVHWIEIIGEAIGRVSEDLRARYPDVDWSDAVKMRNRLAHGYFSVDLDIVWNAVQGELPELERHVRSIVDDLMEQ